MTDVLSPFREAATYRSLLFLTAAIPLGTLGAVLVITGWSVALGVLITPLVIAVLLGFRPAVGGLAALEASVARTLLGADVGRQRLTSGGSGYWRSGKAVLTDGSFWRQQGYLLLRFVLGGPIAVALLSLLGSGLSLAALPIYYRWTHTDANGILRVHTLQKALLVAPGGVVVVLLSVQLIRPLAALWRNIAGAMLTSSETRPSTPGSTMRALRLHEAATAIVVTLVVLIWALTGGPFWPIWVMLALGLVLALHVSAALAVEHRDLAQRYGLTPAAATNVGATLSFALFFVLVWAAAGRGYFWPVWPILAFGGVLAAHLAIARSPRWAREAEMEQRIETLETTRAGAVDVQESELRRIERDLHDGAQARLVALGMNLGMAEQKLASDPAAAHALVSEARTGIEEALRELRDLARGIHPPVLTDRGLEAAIAALADRSAIPVTVDADVPERPAAAVETAAYFVAAEALTNAAKHSGGTKVEVRIVRRPKTLVVEVTDDGRGGADPAGSGLTGLRRRVEALDGSLFVSSPSAGGTTLRAELPCAS